MIDEAPLPEIASSIPDDPLNFQWLLGISVFKWESIW